MATNTDGVTNGCTLLWKIENISHCYFKKGGIIRSPYFIAEALADTKWWLGLCPMGYSDENYIQCYLFRHPECKGPDVIDVNWQIALLDKNGLLLTQTVKLKLCLQKGNVTDFEKLVERNKVFVAEREAFLSEDTLTVQCTIWKKDETPIITKHVFARTVFEINKWSFVWRIDEFSKRKPGLRNTIMHNSVQFDFILKEETEFIKTLAIDIISFKDDMKYFSLKISFINSEGKKEECGVLEFSKGDLKIGVLPIPLFSKMLVENKLRYLQKDVLLLHCEYGYSNGNRFHEIFHCGIISPDETKLVIRKDKTSVLVNDVRKETSQQTSVLANDFRSLYEDEIFSDVELRTSTKTFPAHKNILSARSPVFRRMFSNDMKENNSGHVNITDFEEDTVHRMLMYIYTDNVEDLQFESASNLYTIADKYEILSLKSRCSSFLKDNLCPENACGVLILADLYNDDDLKGAAQDYILGQRKEFFSSQEWKHFMDTHLKLAADVMYKKIF